MAADGPDRSDRLRRPRFSRRRLLRTGALAAAAPLAGCGGDGGTTDSGGDGGGGTTPTGDGGGTAAGDDTPTPTAASDGSAPLGADVLGGPDDLQSEAEVRATVLEEDQGAGRYVFTPAVVWLEPGGTVYWTFEETDHTVTVYHTQYDKPLRIPNGVETPFNSEFTGAGAPGTSFNFIFDSTGVWNYFCKPHEDRGMVGLVVVGGPQAQGGIVKPTEVESEAAREKLIRLLKSGDIVETS